MKKRIYFSDLILFFKMKKMHFALPFMLIGLVSFLKLPLEKKSEEHFSPNHFCRCFIDMNRQISAVNLEKTKLEGALVGISAYALFPHPITGPLRDDNLVQAFDVKRQIVHRIEKTEEALETIPKKWVINHFFKGRPGVAIKHPKLSRYFRLAIALLSGLVGAGAYFAIMVRHQSSRKGLPVSTDTLKKLGHHVIGDIDLTLSETLPSQVSESTADLLRQGIDLSTSVLGVIGPNGSHPPTLIAELFARENKKVLLIDLTYRPTADLTSGLWQYIHSEVVECPIMKKEGYDFLSLGKWRGDDRDITSNAAFAKLLDEKKRCYDHIILFTGASAISPEGIAVQKLSDGVVLSLDQESIKDLEACPAWDSGDGRLAFFYKN
ncbi:MAG: hypothetical protein P0S94_03540 [Simkaniaceae bacterium]|nr:hypothetical protein [Simkaniaceae bacterium]